MTSLKEIANPDKTGPSRFRLELSLPELGLLSDLLSSVNDSRAAPLRQTIEKYIRSDVLFDLWIKKSIVLCNCCSGSGIVKLWDDYLQDNISSPCRKCQNTGRLLRFTTIRFESYIPSLEDQPAPIH